jgi:hypothetical protein
VKRLSEILFQVDEACRFVEDGRQEPLRVALLLLDNATELQMDWAIGAELSSADFREKLRSLALEIPDAERPADLQWLLDWQPLTRRQKAQIDRNFNEKVDFLASLPGKLDSAIRAPLKHLHQYRNQAYHRGQVRPATLAIACRLLVEINCELLLSLGSAGSSYASDEDYSWLEKRFGVSAVQTLGDRTFLQRAAEEMRRRVLVDSSALRVALSDHLEARITDLRNAIAFVLENTQRFGSPAELFRASQYRSAVNRGEAPAAPLPPGTYEPRFGLQVLDDLLGRRLEISATTSRIDAFRIYSALETTLELFEDDVHSLASEVDRAIQWAVDIARVK